jgi:hypothetical protein
MQKSGLAIPLIKSQMIGADSRSDPIALMTSISAQGPHQSTASCEPHSQNRSQGLGQSIPLQQPIARSELVHRIERVDEVEWIITEFGLPRTHDLQQSPSFTSDPVQKS